MSDNLECKNPLEAQLGSLYVEGLSPGAFSVNRSLPCTDFQGFVYFFKYTIQGPTRFSSCRNDMFNYPNYPIGGSISLYTGSCDNLQCFLPGRAISCPLGYPGQYLDVLGANPGTTILIAVYSPPFVSNLYLASLRINQLFPLNDKCTSSKEIASSVPISGDLRLVV